MSTSRTSIKHALSKTGARLRSRGAGEVFGEWTGRIKGSVRSEDELLFLERDAKWDGAIARKTEEPLELVKATAADGKDYERFIGTDSALTFAARLSHETNCWLIRGRGIVLHATWTTAGAAWTREIQRLFVSPPGSAYIYESFTRADARGLGLYPYALVGIGERLAAEGITKLYVGVEVDNTPSLKAITKAGFEPAFGLKYGRRFGRLQLEAPSGPDRALAERVLRPA